MGMVKEVFVDTIMWPFLENFLAKWGFCGHINWAFGQVLRSRKLGHKVFVSTSIGLLATFFSKLATLKPALGAALRAFWPVGHFFSLLIAKEKIIYII